jgi:hypothetical protein
MDKNSNLTSVDTYDSDFSVEEIEMQTKEHFAEMRKLMNSNPTCGTCDWFNGETGDGEQFCDELENYVSEKFYCNKHKVR